MKTAIVTGVAGFIGSHLAERLIKKNYKVIGIDCYTDYYSKKIKKDNLKNCFKSKNFIFLEKDIMNLNLEPILRKADYLFHEAAQPGVRNSWGDEFKIYVKNNIMLTQKILESAKKVKHLKKIIMASSSSVYGNQKGTMIEDKTLPNPISPYGVTKYAAESLGNTYAKNYNLPVISLRYFTVYGPRQRPDMAFSRFILAALSNKPIIVYGDGNQTRDFTFVSDIIDANMSCIENNIDSDIINVGGGHIISINKVLNLLSEKIDKPINIHFMKKQSGDVEHTNADIEKASKLLKYKPQITVKEGLDYQIAEIRKTIK